MTDTADGSSQRVGDSSGTADPGGPPALQRLHSDETIASHNQSSYKYWSSKTNQEIIDSLASGSSEPLIVKESGMVMQGNTRIMVLQRRGVDVNALPRVPYP
jgi:hypothetical protein